MARNTFAVISIWTDASLCPLGLQTAHLDADLAALATDGVGKPFASKNHFSVIFDLEGLSENMIVKCMDFLVGAMLVDPKTSEAGGRRDGRLG